MFKKIVSVVLLVAVFATSAMASSNQGLKAAFDELNYTLTVEWDQKDKTFYDAQMRKFTSTLRALQSEGLTNAQLVDFVKSEVKNEKVARDLETAFSMIAINKMSSADASKYMVDTMKKSYSAGASWNGDAVIYIALGVLLIAAAVSVATGNASAGVGNGGYYCTDYYVCDQVCYYDSWGYYTCYDDCYWTCY